LSARQITEKCCCIYFWFWLWYSHPLRNNTK
jgi:hypothetical protein